MRPTVILVSTNRNATNCGVPLLNFFPFGDIGLESSPLTAPASLSNLIPLTASFVYDKMLWRTESGPVTPKHA